MSPIEPAVLGKVIGKLADALAVERAVSDFWEAEAARNAENMADGPNLWSTDAWMGRWCGHVNDGVSLREDNTARYCRECWTSAQEGPAATMPAIIWWHAHRRTPR